MRVVVRRLAVLIGFASAFYASTTAGGAEHQPVAKELVTAISRDPAQVTLAQLVQQADVVALITILSGDTENYLDVVYKASVIQAFKGTADAQLIYFGPFRSYGVGSEYVVALKRTDKRLADLAKNADGSSRVPFDGAAPYLRIMYEGYSVMSVEYTCALPSCDYAVDIAYSQVTLPADVSMTPNPDHSGASDHGWVRKREFLAALSRITPSGKP